MRRVSGPHLRRRVGIAWVAALKSCQHLPLSASGPSEALSIQSWDSWTLGIVLYVYLFTLLLFLRQGLAMRPRLALDSHHCLSLPDVGITGMSQDA